MIRGKVIPISLVLLRKPNFLKVSAYWALVGLLKETFRKVGIRSKTTDIGITFPLIM